MILPCNIVAPDGMNLSLSAIPNCRSAEISARRLNRLPKQGAQDDQIAPHQQADQMQKSLFTLSFGFLIFIFLIEKCLARPASMLFGTHSASVAQQALE
jgi:hypothetical protein